MVILRIGSFLLLGTAIIAAFFFFRRAGEIGLGPAGSEIGSAFQSIGSGIGAFGGGFSELGTGIGTGVVGLFKPLLFFKDLLFGGEPIVNSPTADTVQATNSNSNVASTGSLTTIQLFN